jgi:O-antigen/teichoic acid export membrane protein
LRPIGVLHRTMDRLIVGAVLGPGAVSLVEIATQMQNGADSVLSSTSYAVVPSAAWLKARQDHDTLRELLHRGTKYSLLVTVPVGLLAAILAGPLVRVWIGARFAEAAGLAAVALAYVLAVGPLQVGSTLLVGVGRAGAILRAAAVALAVNFGLSLVLVHAVGIVGVFQASLVSAALLVVPLGRAVLREVGSPVGDFLRTGVAPVLLPAAGLAGVAGLAVAAPVPDGVTLVLGGLGGLAIYAAMAFRWSVRTDELEELRSLVGRSDGGTVGGP